MVDWRSRMVFFDDEKKRKKRGMHLKNIAKIMHYIYIYIYVFIYIYIIYIYILRWDEMRGDEMR